LIDKEFVGNYSFVHDDNEKKRCPSCSSLDTKKQGYIYSKIRSSRGLISRKTQRYFCKSCSLNFTASGFNIRKKISDELKRKAVNDYVLTKNSLQEVAERYNVSRSSILNWLSSVSNEYPQLKSIKLKSKLSGLIQIDGKELKIKGERRSLLVAIDARTKHPIHYGLYKGETKESSSHFLIQVKKNYGTKIKGIISDFGRGKCFIPIVQEILPDVPHQICLVHYMRYVWLFLPRTRRSEFFWRNAVLKVLIKRIITSDCREESLMWLQKLKELIPFFRATYHKRFIRSIIVNYESLTRYYDYGFLQTNTNAIENLNRQFERKLKNMDGFKSEENVKDFLRIWFANYRIKLKNRRS